MQAGIECTKNAACIKPLNHAILLGSTGLGASNKTLTLGTLGLVWGLVWVVWAGRAGLLGVGA